MKRVVFLMILALAGCDEATMASLGATGGTSAGRTTSAFTEQLVIGSSMSFAQCQAKGGFIIRDQGSPMVACDPSVVRAAPPADDLQHPTVQPGAGPLNDA